MKSAIDAPLGASSRRRSFSSTFGQGRELCVGEQHAVRIALRITDMAVPDIVAVRLEEAVRHHLLSAVGHAYRLQTMGRQKLDKQQEKRQQQQQQQQQQAASPSRR